MSDDNHDKFHDFQAEWGGLFSQGQGLMGDGLASFDAVKSVLTPQGLVNEFQCRATGQGGGCGCPMQILVTWPELVALKVGISPHLAYKGHPRFNQFAEDIWQRADPRAGKANWKPIGLRCGKCQEPAFILITSQEAAKHVAAGKAQGWTPAFEVELGQLALARRRQLGG